MTAERRQQKRLAVPLEGRWQGGSGAARCRISDISVSGCFIHCLSQPAPGERTKITVEFRESDALTLAGTVVYAEAGIGFAVQFADLDPEVRAVLKAQVATLDTVE